MLKKLFIAALFATFMSASASAQESKVENFLGSWKMTKFSGSQKNESFSSMRLTISQSGDEITIVRSPQSPLSSKDFPVLQTNRFNLDGSVSVHSLGSRSGGKMENRLSVPAANKLRFDSEMNDDIYITKIREVWKISDDGKTLTVESFYSISSKIGSGSPFNTASTKITFSRE